MYLYDHLLRSLVNAFESMIIDISATMKNNGIGIAGKLSWGYFLAMEVVYDNRVEGRATVLDVPPVYQYTTFIV